MESSVSKSQDQNQAKADRTERFVLDVIHRCQKDKGLCARLRRADNPATEYQSWEFLAAYHIDLVQDVQRLPFAAIAAVIAKSKSGQNGVLRLGQAIANCYEEGKESNQAKARLRRLLACNDLPEVCRILRPIFSLILSKTSRPLDYIRILRQLQRYPLNSQRVRAEWAQEFYGQALNSDEGERSA